MNTNHLDHLPARITECREAVGLSQSLLAKVLGVTRGAVSNWEAGQRTPTLEQAAALAVALGVSLDALLTAPAHP